MQKLHIIGPAKLKGTVSIHGSKNATLPLLFASILFDSTLEYENIPRLWDVETTLKLLESMGASYSWDKERGKVSLFPSIQHKIAHYEWVRRMRAGILALGPLIARYGEAKVSLPGGCAIGVRPVDLHIKALEEMNVALKIEEGYIKACVKGRLKPAKIRFPQVTVTGTENILYVAASIDGVSIIENAAQEPEVTALAKFLQECGAEIEGIGSHCLKIKGNPSLTPPSYPILIPSDRIEAGTWIAASVCTQSPLTLIRAPIEDMKATLNVFQQMGVEFKIWPEEKKIEVFPHFSLKPLQVQTAPYPGLATDMQAQITVCLLRALGISSVEETIFENRFMHIAELNRMGAGIKIEHNKVWIEGPKVLKGTTVMATDLRASASLVLAALMAEGTTTILRIYHLDRGYQRLDETLRTLGVTAYRTEASLP